MSDRQAARCLSVSSDVWGMVRVSLACQGHPPGERLQRRPVQVGGVPGISGRRPEGERARGVGEEMCELWMFL